MRSHPKKGIFSRILAGYIALALAVVALTGCICFFLVKQMNIASNLRDLERKADLVAEMVGQPGGKTRVLSSGRLYELQKLTDARFIYVDPDMVASLLLSPDEEALDEEMLAPSDYDIARAEVIDTLDKKLIEEIFKGETVSEARHMALLDRYIVLSGAPIRDLTRDEPSGVAGAILLYRPVGDISSVARRIALLFAVAGFLAICVALVVSWALSRRIARPVTLLNSAAKGIAEGDIREISGVKGPWEIEELGGTINSLSGKLRATIESLSDEKSKLQQILQGIGEGIVAIDEKGEIAHHNSAALQLLETSAWRLDGELGRQGDLRVFLERAMRERSRFESDWVNPSGKKLRASVYPVYDDAGMKASGSVALVRDVSEAARLEQMRRDYIANISHELRTPLTGIRGMIEPLLDGYIETDEERGDCYRVIYQETVRLEKLISDMLDMSRLQGGRVKLELQPLEAKGILLSALTRMKKRAAEAGIALRMECGEAPLLCVGDEDRTLQVLTIFLDNAFGFTPGGGSITVYGRSDGITATLGVRDTGSGVDPKDLPYIWERFYKADRSRMRTTGTGLGLSIAKMVVELMNGEIGVSSELGRGSDFYIRLPVAKIE